MAEQKTFTALSGSSTGPITGAWIDIKGYKRMVIQARSSAVNGELRLFITSAQKNGSPDDLSAYEYTPFVNTNAPSWTAMSGPILRPIAADYFQLRWIKQSASVYGPGDVLVVVSAQGE